MSARSQGTAVTSRGKRRRRWTAEQKRQIVAESIAPGASAATVARQHGVSSGQVYAWRQELLLDGALATAAGTGSSLVDVAMTTTAQRLVAALPAPLGSNTVPAQVAPTPPIQPDGDIMQPGDASAPGNGELGAEDAATTNSKIVLNSPIATRADRGQADRSGQVVPTGGRRRALGGFCQVGVTRRSPVPWKQLVNLMLFGTAGDQAFQHIGEPCKRLDAIQLCARNKRHCDGPSHRSAVVASEQAFFLVRVTGRMPRSTTLVSSSMRPSSRNNISPDQ